MSYSNLPHSAPVGGPSGGPGVRASMPPPARSPPATGFVNNQPPSSSNASRSRFESTITEEAADPDAEEVGLHSAGRDEDDDQKTPTSKEEKRKSRAGTMNKAFKFPPDAPSQGSPSADGENGDDSQDTTAGTPKERVTPPAKRPKESTSGIEVPPPPPVEKERASRTSLSDDDDLGDDTVDIPL